MPIYFRSEANITVPFEEIWPSPQENYSPAGFSSTRELKCVYSARHTLARQLLGLNSKTIGLVSVRLPHRHPSFLKAFAQSVDIKSFAKEAGSPGAPSTSAVATYDHAILCVRYAIPDGITFPNPDEDIKDITRTERLETSAQFITIPDEQLFFDNDQKIPAEGVNPGLLMVTQDWTVTLFNEPEVPQGLFDLINGVNDRPIKSRKLDKTFETETLLYNTPSYDRAIASDGSSNLTITFRLTYNPFGWNKFVRPGVFDQVVVDGVIKKLPKFVTLFDDAGNDFVLYAPKDFSKIIAP